MNAINSQRGFFFSPVIFNPTILAKKVNPSICSPPSPNDASGRGIRLIASSSGNDGEKQTAKRGFLSLEEAGLVEISGLSSHERFLCRLTISSLNLLRVISEQEGCSIEELNAGKVCDWFLKDKLKREQNLDSAVLQWDDSEFLM